MSDRLEKNRARFHSILAIPMPKSKKQKRLLERSLTFRGKKGKTDHPGASGKGDSKWGK